MRHFNDVNDFLWVLPRGEIKNNVALLKQSPIGTQMAHVRCKLIGWCSQLVDGVRLLLYIGWDTFASEFGPHLDISAKEFSIRSAWRQSRALLSIDPNDVRIAKLERHKARLQRKHFGQNNGRHAFFRERYHRASRTTKKVSPERRSIT